MTDLLEMGQRARAAARRLASAPTAAKNRALEALAQTLLTQAPAVLAANAQDVEAARARGLAAHVVDRLLLDEHRLRAIAADLRRVAELPDPVGEVFDATVLPNGLRLHKQRVPLGVLGVIYESRPNVTVDVAGLALKAGDAAVLRGGSETLHSNRALAALARAALAEAGLPEDAVQFIDSPDRALVLALLQLADYVDLIIPRGGASLHAFCRENSRIPVITGGTGICHLYVDDTADLDRALAVIHNAKTQKPSACNSLDTVLVHAAVAADFLPRLVQHLRPAGVAFRAHANAVPHLEVHYTGAYLKVDPATGEEQLKYGRNVGRRLPEGVQPAGPDDFDTEWLALVLGLQVVESLDEAIAHINAHSLAHSDGILTRTAAHAERFVAEVDSAAVYVNASTRFTDGGQFGLGAEVAVSTQRLHARGPLGLREITTYKWVATGDYHARG